MKYPPPVDPNNWNAKGCYGWINSKMDLGKAAIMGGNPIMSNGGKVNKISGVLKILKCSSFILSSQSKITSSRSNREQHIPQNDINLQKNNFRKKDGATGSKTVACKFSFFIKVDFDGFYLHLKKKTGYPLCSGHP